MTQLGQTYFEWLQLPENKATARDFTDLMTYATRFRKSWMDVFPPDYFLQEVQASNATIFVDIGDGAGTDVLEFRRRFPDVLGRVYLQELSSVIEMARENKELISQVGSLPDMLMFHST